MARALIAFLDVDYREAGARAACVAAEGWDAAAPMLERVAEIGEVAEYRPGEFYRRELPCLLAVLRLLPRLPETIVIDANVWLSPERAPGLGTHLHQAIGGAAAVIGVAKTAFRGLAGDDIVAPVLRGGSQRPLFVTSVGIALDDAAAAVRAMHGPHRTPTLIARADRLARDAA